MLPAYKPNFAEFAHTARQIALYLTSAELWGCLSQQQCIVIVEHCMKFFLFPSCKKDLEPEFCISIIVYTFSVFYLTKPTDDPGSVHDGIFNSIFSIGDKSGKCFESFYNLCKSVRKLVDRHI